MTLEIKAPLPPRLPLGHFEAEDHSGSIIDEALTAVRNYFGMPVAYLSEFVEDDIIFRAVSAPGLDHLIKPGDAWPSSEVYCTKILSGELPQLIPDTSMEQACQDLAITHSVPIRSHVSLPVRRADGSVYGMFCCLSPQPNPTLNQRDLTVMSTFASLAARQIQMSEVAEAEMRQRRADIAAILRDGSFDSVYQPLVDLASRRVVGVEALTRFRGEPYRTPDVVFDTATQVGLGVELETATLERALKNLQWLPDDLYLTFNASPDLVCGDALDRILPRDQCHRLCVEVTEHQDITDFDRFRDRLHRLRGIGIRVAIDDVGAGYSGFQRIARVGPDILKLDRSITEGVDINPSHRAVVAALVHFAGETGATVLVEGVEREEEAATLRDLGITRAQGWLFGRPMPLSDLFPKRAAAAG